MKDVSEFLLKITDTRKYSNREIFDNLKDCLVGKKACVFSCGPNLTEYQDRFNEIENDDTLIKCCFKGSINIIKKCDIFGIGNYLKSISIPDNTFTCLFKLSFSNSIMDMGYQKLPENILVINSKRFNTHVYKKNSLWKWDDITIQYEDGKIIQEEYIDCFYNFIDFLLYIGIKEFYLFGLYHHSNMIHLEKYDYIEMIRKNHHFSDKINNGICVNALEPSDWNSIICSYYLNEIMIKQNATCYNVSNTGIVSNRINRITFDSIFSDKKEFVRPYKEYTDFIDQLNKFVDFDFYYKKYIDKADITEMDKKLLVFQNIILEGIYCIKSLNPTLVSIHEIEVNMFSINVFCSVCFIKNYPLVKKIDRGQIHIFFCHYANEFNYKVCNIYNKDVFNEKYFDSLLTIYMDRLTLFKLNASVFLNGNLMHHFIGFKYFKLLVWLYTIDIDKRSIICT